MLDPTTMRALEVGMTIRDVLTDDLRSDRYRGHPNKMTGHCYVASEAAYHILGGKEAGWTPQFIHHENEPHWFLKHSSGIVLDITASQFVNAVPVSEATGRGFLTVQPSKRAQKILDVLMPRV